MYSLVSNLVGLSELFQKRFLTECRLGAFKAYFGCKELNKAPFSHLISRVSFCEYI